MNWNDYQLKASRHDYGLTYMNPVVITNQKQITDSQNQKERNSSIRQKRINSQKEKQRKINKEELQKQLKNKK